MNAFCETLKTKAFAGENISREEAERILTDTSVDMMALALAAGEVRMKTFGRTVKIHQINNIQNGYCPEDCGYCGQSKETDAEINPYKMKGEDDIVAEAKAAKAAGVSRYCMVSSGRGLNDKKTGDLSRLINRIDKEVGIKTCLSAGFVSLDQAKSLKEAGLDRLNHNLNTSEAHTPNIVSTHTYDDRMDTIRNSRAAGLSNCSGMIVGMNETNDDIFDVAQELRKAEVPSIPINFLVPVEGNRIYDCDQLNPEKCLRILCLFRFINPTAELRMGGGREGHLRGLQSLALYPANSVFVDGYLVTRGEKKNKVYRLIEDAGFEVEGGNPIDLKEDASSSKFDIDGDADIRHEVNARPCSSTSSCS